MDAAVAAGTARTVSAIAEATGEAVAVATVAAVVDNVAAVSAAPDSAAAAVEKAVQTIPNIAIDVGCRSGLEGRLSGTTLAHMI